jgi:hypothetical protein
MNEWKDMNRRFVHSRVPRRSEGKKEREEKGKFFFLLLAHIAGAWVRAHKDMLPREGNFMAKIMAWGEGRERGNRGNGTGGRTDG